MIDRSDVLARAHLLLGPAETVLRARLAASPDEPAMRWRLAEVLRQRGDLPAAAEACRAVLAADPDHDRAAVVLTALEGRPLPADAGPSPFAVVSGLLQDDERAALWTDIEAHTDQFVEATVGTTELNAKIRHETRSAQVLTDKAFPSVAQVIRDRIPALVRAAWAERGLPTFEPTRIDLILSIHRDGGFFKAHRDDAHDGVLSTREVSFVYYLHRHPRRFEGGDLLLIDEGVRGGSYTRIRPEDGRLVMFPSRCLHQVTPVSCASGTFGDARFAVTGWLHRDPAA